jgi:sortase A
MPAKAKLAQILLERAFVETIETGVDVKPWSWADTWPIARIEVKRLNANAIVLHGSSGQALAFGPGHIENTAQAGGAGTAVYSAHRDTHFRFLKDVKIGDDIDVTRRDGTLYRYRVTHFSVVHWDQSGIDPFAEGHNLVLVTCWPLTDKFPGPMRYLVHAKLVAQEPSPSVIPDAPSRSDQALPAVSAGVGLTAKQARR